MKKFVIWGGVALLLAGCIDAKASKLPQQTVPVSTKSTIDDAPKQVEPESAIVTSAGLVAIGDVLLHQPVYKDAQTGQGTYDFTPMFEKVKPYIDRADLAIANQETMIGGVELGLSGYPAFNSPFEIGNALKETGIDLVTLANNHTLDRGEKGILNAIDHWNRIGMPYTGAYQSEEDRDTIRTIEKNGIVFSFLSYSYGTNGLPVPEGKPYLINLIDEELIREDVERAKGISDVVVVSMHWGNEYESLPNEWQIDWAQELSDMGVDIIIGHHPHVLQPIDWIKREDGTRTLVFYSLGNFLSSQEGLERLTGGIGEVRVIKTVYRGRTSITLNAPSFLPTFGYYENKRNFEVIPIYQLDDSMLPNYEAHYENVQNHMKEFIEDLSFTER